MKRYTANELRKIFWSIEGNIWNFKSLPPKRKAAWSALARRVNASIAEAYKQGNEDGFFATRKSQRVANKEGGAK